MEEGFIISFPFKGTEYNINAKFVRLGYIHQFHLVIDEIPLIIEFDEERAYRVINPQGNSSTYFEADFMEELVQRVSKLH